MSNDKTKTIAIICDCDNTLIPDTTSQLLEKNGIEPQPFWNMIDEMVTKGWDPPLAWMTEIVKLVKEGKISQNSNEKLAEFGATLETFPGAASFISEINESIGDELDVKVEGYVVSSGIESLMKGTKLSNSFTDIFGGNFSEKDGVIDGVRSSVTFTEKTKFVYAINKGITSNIREIPYNVNKFVNESERIVAFEDMMYLGDGPSDIPCFSMIHKLGGAGIAVASKDSWSKKWEKELRSRAMETYEPDFTANSELRKIIESTISFLINKK